MSKVVKMFIIHTLQFNVCYLRINAMKAYLYKVLLNIKKIKDSLKQKNNKKADMQMETR